MSRPREDIVTRFWAKVNIKGPDECWEWIACKSASGYGRLKVYDRSREAHQLSWELTNGPIPPNKLVLHKCDNRSCVNPNHLYIGTHSDNICDAVTRERGCFKPTKKHDTSINALVNILAKIDLNK